MSKNYLISFGGTTQNFENVNNKIHMKEMEESYHSHDNINEFMECSPRKNIKTSLQNHNFTFNHNNISYLNSNQNSSITQDDKIFLEKEFKQYQEKLEEIKKSNESLLVEKELLIKELREIKKKKENKVSPFDKFNPFLRISLPKSSDFQKNKNISGAKIKELEFELAELKQKYEIIEKEHNNEMVHLKVFLKNSQISGESTNNQPSDERQNELSKLNEKLELLISENNKINHYIAQFSQEITFLKNSNPLYKERHEYLKNYIKNVEEPFKSKEIFLNNEIAKAELHLKDLIKANSDQIKNNKFDPLESLILSSSMLTITPEKKIEFLTNENKKIEEEIQKWKIQYWNLEKKAKKKENMNPELKYTEMDLNDIISKVNKKHINTQNELINKMNVLENEINKLSRKNPITLRQLVSPEKKKDEKEHQQNLKKNIQSEKKDKLMTQPLGYFKISNQNNNAERKIYKYGLYSNSLGNSNQSNLHNMTELNSKKPILNSISKTQPINYSEKVLRKMKK